MKGAMHVAWDRPLHGTRIVTFVVSLISAGVGLRFLDECWLFARNRARCSADVLNDSVIISLSRF